jgi:hypothetical protein
MGSRLSLGATLQNSRTVFWDICGRNGRGESAVKGESSILFLPCSLRNPRKRSFDSPPVVGGLPELVAPLTEKDEGELVYSLLKDINDNFGLNLDPYPTLERGAVTLDEGDRKKRIIIIGGSHMCRTISNMPKETVSLATPGFVAAPAVSSHVAETLRGYGPGPQDVIDMDLLSNSAFCGTDINGLPLPPCRGEDGIYHVQGLLVASPPSMIKKGPAIDEFNCRIGQRFALRANCPDTHIHLAKVLLQCRPS